MLQLKTWELPCIYFHPSKYKRCANTIGIWVGQRSSVETTFTFQLQIPGNVQLHRAGAGMIPMVHKVDEFTNHLPTFWHIQVG